MTAGRPRDVIYTFGRIEAAEASFLEASTDPSARKLRLPHGIPDFIGPRKWIMPTI